MQKTILMKQHVCSERAVCCVCPCARAALHQHQQPRLLPQQKQQLVSGFQKLVVQSAQQRLWVPAAAQQLLVAGVVAARQR
jgi:hypothetical protein